MEKETYGLIDQGVRKRVVIGGENFYLSVFPGAIFCTIPRENDPCMSEARMIAETLCREINLIQEENNI